MRSVFLAAAILSFLSSVIELRGEEKDWVFPGNAAVRERLLFAQAASPNRETKMRSLSAIDHDFAAGTLSSEDGVALSVLTYLVQEGVKTKTRGASAERDYPDVRRAACEILGRIGGARAKETLLSVLESEEEPMVLSEAVYALAVMGGKPDSRIFPVLTRLIDIHVLAKNDDNLAYACLLAIEKLDTPEHRLDDPDLYRALLRMLDAPLIGEVRRKAYFVLDKLRK